MPAFVVVMEEGRYGLWRLRADNDYDTYGMLQTVFDWLVGCVVYEPGSVGQGIWPDLLLCFRSPTSRLGRSEHFYIKCHLFLILLAVNNDVVNLYICSLLFVVAVCPFIVVCHPFVVYSLSMVENETSWQQNCTLPTTRRPRSVQLEVPGMA